MRLTATLHRNFRAAVLLALVATALTGCPYPTQFEDIYGYNRLTIRNEGDRPIDALFVHERGSISRGANYLEDAPPLAPGESLTLTQLPNAYYVAEIEYVLTAEEAGTDEPVRASASLGDIKLFWGEDYTWHWYGPTLPGPEQPADK